MPRICDFSYKESGPLPQTLFLGCSISNVTFNMAWGSEPSQCTVRLVKDTSAHPNSPDFGSVTTTINTIVNTTTNSLFVNNADLNVDRDPNYTAHKNISKEEQKRENDRLDTDISNTPLSRNRDTGKKCWNPHLLANDPANWLGPDPGFVGDNSFVAGHIYDSVGCPVYFKLDDLEFGGLLNSWKVESAIYTAEIQGPGRLLKGCQLILNEYQGSISTVMPNATAFADGTAISIPYIKFKNDDGSIRPFNGDIRHGNMPNLFNIYGYLIETRGFQNVDISELGISAAQVYDGLVELLAGGPDTIVTNPFSPYGGIVAKSLVYFGANNATQIIDPTSTTINYAGSSINLTQLGFFRHILAVDNIYRPLFRLDLSQVPRPPDGIYLDLTNNMSLDDFITKCCDGAGFDWNCSLEPDLNSSLFSGRILIRTYDRKIQPSTKIIRGLISNLTVADRIISYNVGETHTDDVNRKVAVGGKQKRLLQLQCNTISKYKHINIYDPDSGLFNNVQDDLVESFLRNGNPRQKVRWPMPESTRPWDSSWGSAYRTYGGAATAQDSNDFIGPEYTYFNTVVTKGNYNTTNPKLSNPDLADQPSDQNQPFAPSFSNKLAYPIQLDLISQYFGRNSDGSLRQVYYDRRQRQYIVNMLFSDLKPIFAIQNFDINLITPYNANGGVVSIFETEIRAALGSFDSWVTYLFEMKKFGYETPTCRLMLTYISQKYGPAIANQLTFYGVGSLKTGETKKEALPTDPPTTDRISPANRIIFQNDILPVLQKLHNFITSELGSKYGKSYLVRLPTIYRRVDSMGMAHYSYEVTDAAWEEFGNFIDDTMQIGSDEVFTLSEADARIGPLLGWNASAERTHNHPMAAAGTNPLPGLLPVNNLGKMILQSDMPQRPNDWYLPLQHSMSPAESVLVQHRSYLIPPGGAFSDRVPGSVNAPQLNDSFGNNIPDPIKAKLYAKASVFEVVPENRVNKRIIFANGIQYAVLESSAPVNTRSEQSLTLSMFENLIAAGVFGLETPGGATRVLTRPIPSNLNNLIFTYGKLRKMVVHSAVVPDYSVDNEINLPIAPLAPTPCFAAIPLQLNYACYGPWVSHPGLIANALFPDNYANPNVLVNNIVGGVEVDINSSYVPWEYGGMDALDSSVLLNLVADSNKYQQVQEEGQITVANMLFRNAELGARLVNAYGPVINAINVDLGEEGIKCTYHFRTYSRKLGFYNKEQANQIQKIAKERLANRKQIADSIVQSRVARMQQAGNGLTSSSLPKSLSYSPVRLLIGGAMPIVHKNSNLRDAFSELNFDAQWFNRPQIQPFRTVTPKDMINHQTSVALYDPQEIPRTLLSPENYTSLSVMSLDGIFSPISFYPTAYGTTYPLSPYPRSHCPICRGGGFVIMGLHSAASSQFRRDSTTSFINVGAMNSSFSTLTKPCKFCVPDIDIEKAKKKSAQPNEITPPMLIASGSDRQILTDRHLAFQFQTCKINTYTLNPIVMSATGSDFSIHQHKQQSDRCGHSVGAVSFGNILPGVADGLAPILTPNIVKNYNDYDINLINHDATYANSYQNQRFFGLRGPIMIHSWGYDLQGYPVPNSSGEYKYGAGNEILYDSNNNAVGKNQVLQSDGTWSAPYKENTFYKGWAQLPTTWPVGPLDLRWDSNARVWTIGANYKPVWVVIETDLLDKTSTARGIVVESSYDNTPLPQGLRKVVFVKDSLGIFSAPRGAALYCRYDTDNGFYEPIYNRPLMTSGQLLGGLNATIFNGYTPSVVSADIVSQYVTTFLNPINFATPAGSLGLFVFLNGSWILQSIRN